MKDSEEVLKVGGELCESIHLCKPIGFFLYLFGGSTRTSEVINRIIGD